MDDPKMQDAITLIDKTYCNFRDAVVGEVLVGPRCEVTLIVRPLVWHGSRGELDAPVAVRFGGIQDFQLKAEKFRAIPSLQSEIGFLGLDQASTTQRAQFHAFRYEAERADYEFGFCCSNVTIKPVQDLC